MQFIYNLLLDLAKATKGRFGYQITIKQAILIAYFGFLAAIYLELTVFLKTIYGYLPASWPTVGNAITMFFPDAIIISSGLTIYIGILTFKKATSYVHDAWQAWIKTTSM